MYKLPEVPVSQLSCTIHQLSPSTAFFVSHVENRTTASMIASTNSPMSYGANVYIFMPINVLSTSMNVSQGRVFYS